MGRGIVVSWRRAIGLLAVVAVVGGATTAYFAYRRPSTSDQLENALAALEHDDPAAVERQLQAWGSNPAYAGHARLIRGGRLLRRGQAKAALDELSTLKPDDELRLPFMLFTTEALLKLGRQGDAERVLRAAIVEEPLRPEPRRRLAALYHEMGAQLKCIAELRELIKLEPNDYQAYRTLGLIFQEDLGQFEFAIENYEHALRCEPPEADRLAIAADLARCYIHNNNYEQALNTLKNSTDSSHVLSMRAECEWALGRLQAARPLLDQALVLDPKNREALILDGRIRMAERDAKGAVVALEAANALDRHDLPVLQLLVAAYRMVGDKAKGDAASRQLKESEDLRNEMNMLLERAIRSPEDVDARRRLAGVWRKLDREDLAVLWDRAADAASDIVPK